MGVRRVWIVGGLTMFGLGVGLVLGELTKEFVEQSNLAAFGLFSGLGLGTAVAAMFRD